MDDLPTHCLLTCKLRMMAKRPRQYLDSHPSISSMSLQFHWLCQSERTCHNSLMHNYAEESVQVITSSSRWIVYSKRTVSPFGFCQTDITYVAAPARRSQSRNVAMISLGSMERRLRADNVSESNPHNGYADLTLPAPPLADHQNPV